MDSLPSQTGPTVGEDFIPLDNAEPRKGATKGARRVKVQMIALFTRRQYTCLNLELRPHGILTQLQILSLLCKPLHQHKQKKEGCD